MDRLIHDAQGLNTGTWPVIAPEHLVTAVERFFTRSHAPVPEIDPDTWRLQVDGLVERPRSFSLGELADTFPEHDLIATLVCAGLRREEFHALGPLPGELAWGPEPASTGRWGGFALDDVLRSVGVAAQARYVEFTGLDQVERHGRRFGFGGSIDLSKAEGREVILATRLNGAPLPAAHGFPLRALVPGWVGARSIKWLGRITLSAEPSHNYFQREAYRVQPEADPHHPRDVSAGTALDALPVNAVILEPRLGHTVRTGRVPVRGWAIGTGGSALRRIELSANAGQDWMPARIAARREPWTWTFWEAFPLLEPGRHTLVVRATDAGGATQPPTVRDTWNVKGYANNAWHRVSVLVE